MMTMGDVIKSCDTKSGTWETPDGNIIGYREFRSDDLDSMVREWANYHGDTVMLTISMWPRNTMVFVTYVTGHQDQDGEVDFFVQRERVGQWRNEHFLGIEYAVFKSIVCNFVESIA